MKILEFTRRLAAHNLGLKIISLLLAVALWAAISTGKLH
jgi:hypothetical protein